MPITEDEKTLPAYSEGLSCHHCNGKVSPDQKLRFAQRQKQVKLAKARGEEHIGTAAQQYTERRRLEKKEKRRLTREAARAELANEPSASPKQKPEPSAPIDKEQNPQPT